MNKQHDHFRPSNENQIGRRAFTKKAGHLSLGLGVLAGLSISQRDTTAGQSACPCQTENFGLLELTPQLLELDGGDTCFSPKVTTGVAKFRFKIDIKNNYNTNVNIRLKLKIWKGIGVGIDPPDDSKQTNSYGLVPTQEVNADWNGEFTCSFATIACRWYTVEYVVVNVETGNEHIIDQTLTGAYEQYGS